MISSIWAQIGRLIAAANLRSVPPLPPNQPVDMSCGTFTPTHTLTGPVPQYATSGSGIVTFYTAPAAVPKDGTVTLYVSATSDPSQYSTVTLMVTQ